MADHIPNTAKPLQDNKPRLDVFATRKNREPDAFASNVRLQRFSSLSSAATASRTQLRAVSARTGARQGWMGRWTCRSGRARGGWADVLGRWTDARAWDLGGRVRAKEFAGGWMGA